MPTLPSLWLAAAACALSACASPSLVSLSTAVPITATPSRAVPLEVITRSTGVRDPLPLRGERFVYADLEDSLGHAVSTAAVPWAQEHLTRRPDGWQLTVELTRASAELLGSRVMVALDVRATLRARSSNRYLAQTQAHCRQGALVDPSAAAPVFYACMMSVGRELAGWLGGVEP